MSRSPAPSMPTERQIQEAHRAVTSLHPGARIERVGPEGVTFVYPEGKTGRIEFENQPFAPARS
jgi:hypothetical protein